MPAVPSAGRGARGRHPHWCGGDRAADRALQADIYLQPTRGLPQFGTAWSPTQGQRGRCRDALAAHRLGAGRPTTLKAARDVYGRAPVNDMYELLDHCARVLVLTSRSFDFLALTLPPTCTMSAPSSTTRTGQTPTVGDPPAGTPLVLVGMGSTCQSEVDALRRVADGLVLLPVRAVLTSGPAVAHREVPAPGNVRVVRAALHLQGAP